VRRGERQRAPADVVEERERTAREAPLHERGVDVRDGGAIGEQVQPLADVGHEQPEPEAPRDVADDHRRAPLPLRQLRRDGQRRGRRLRARRDLGELTGFAGGQVPQPHPARRFPRGRRDRRHRRREGGGRDHGPRADQGLQRGRRARRRGRGVAVDGDRQRSAIRLVRGGPDPGERARSLRR
jgi:hypothetical protein